MRSLARHSTQEGGAFALPSLPEPARRILAILDSLGQWDRAVCIDALVLRLDADDVVGRDPATGAPILAEELDASWPTVGSETGRIRAGFRYDGTDSDDNEEHDHSGGPELYTMLPAYGLDQSEGPINERQAARALYRELQGKGAQS